MLATLRSVSWRWASGAGVRKLAMITDQMVSELDLTANLKGSEPLGSLSKPQLKKLQGERILHLYFRQWLVSDGLFLDLRANRFGLWEDELGYYPNGLWVSLRPEFRTGMLALYQSFYSDDEQAFDQALRTMGLLQPGLSDAAETELKALLHRHFGIEQTNQVFRIDDFKASFDELFEFFIANDCSLHSDFVFVGFYLITLYLTLEQLGQPYDVNRVCAEALLARP